MVKTQTTGGARVDTAARLREVGLDRLRFEDILAALEQDGIRDLEQLVKRELAEARRYAEAAARIDVFSSAAMPAADEATNSIHRPPEMPILIDGVLHDPKDITRFNGKALHFIAPRPGSDEHLRAYSGDKWQQSLSLYIQMRDMLSLFDVTPLDFPIPGVMPPPGPGGPGFPPPPPFVPVPGSPGTSHDPPRPEPTPPPATPPPRPSEAQFFSDAGYSGDWLWLGPRLQWSDLTRVSRARTLFWSSDWNDVISSVISWFGIVVLCEHINLGGSSFGIQAGIPIFNLASYGWNDKTSSIVNWG
jgi:hypothetical protein